MVKNLFFDANIDCYNHDVIFHPERFDKIVKQRQNYCLFFESCNSPADLIKFIYLQFKFIYSLFQSLQDIFADFDDSYGLSVFYQKKFNSINICSAIWLLSYIIFLSIM